MDVTQCPLASIPEERRSREAFLAAPDSSVARAFEAVHESIDDPGCQARIGAARSYAEGLAYDHPGQRKDVYLAHPLRVATLYLGVVRPADAFGATVALVHNTLEVAEVTRAQLAAAIGESVAAAVDLLTVDRPRQWDPAYKEAYYGAIASAERPVRVVKVLDKLDNLFLLHRNPDAEIRSRYLDEIERHVLPMARADVPPIADYIEDLVADNRRIGPPLTQRGEGTGGERRG